MAAKRIKKVAKKKVTEQPKGPKKDILYYAEFYEHYLGNRSCSGFVTRPDLKKVAIVYHREKVGLFIQEDPDGSEIIDSVFHTDGHTLMANEIFPYNSNALKRYDKIIKAIDKDGSYGQTGEEGSWALAKTKAAACRKVEQLELKVKNLWDSCG